jgi:hypothetical protein
MERVPTRCVQLATARIASIVQRIVLRLVDVATVFVLVITRRKDVVKIGVFELVVVFFFLLSFFVS